MIKQLAILMIRFYQWLVSPLFGPCCRFTPSCSAYTVTCIQRFGAAKGALLAGKRILKCRPFGPSGYDPPPRFEPKNRTTTMRKA